MTQQAYERLPEELRARPQWLLASPNEHGELKVPTTVNLSGDLRPGSHSDASTWLDFDYALACAREFGLGLGYVLSADDPFTCVDFDVKNEHNKPNNPELWTKPEDFERMRMLMEDLDSYTEWSQSGQGVHVWCRANIGEGLKRAGVEVYSQQRFIVCTGRSLHNPAKPIVDRQEELGQLTAAMRAAAEHFRTAGLDNFEGQAMPDEELWRRASTAENAVKFMKLWSGEWQSMGYPSQSEADLSLMSMLAFYSQDNEQCRRMFRYSKLGERPKALDNDRYLDYTLRLIRGRQKREEEQASRIAAQAEGMLANYAAKRAVAEPSDEDRAAAAAYAAQLQAQGAPGAAGMPELHPHPTDTPPAPPTPDGALPWPPGLVGDIARFVYHAAPRPVREVAIVAALGWMAGVCGKAWVIPGSGLNLYIILVARSAIGKEAMHTGLSALIHRIRDGEPVANSFVNFSDFASGPALAKACVESSSFVHVSGEFGRKLQQMAQHQQGPLQTLRTTMTHLYQKSGPASIVGGIQYSNKESNIAAISGVAYSMIGETTPSTLYASLTESMMEDGFLSRFTLVEYDGLRPAANNSVQLVPSNELAAKCQELCRGAAYMIGNNTRIMVRRDDAAAQAMDAFDRECDSQINSTTDEGWRQMWNRAHLKMCRIAALLSIGDSTRPDEPLIRLPHVEWALDLVRRDIALMRRRMESGDVGVGDDSRMKKLLYIVHEFLSQPLSASYGVPSQMQVDGVIPRKYLQIRTARVASFYQAQQGGKRALDDAINSCLDNGYLVEMPKEKAGEQYTYQGRCFRVVQLPQFN